MDKNARRRISNANRKALCAQSLCKGLYINPGCAADLHVPEQLLAIKVGFRQRINFDAEGTEEGTYSKCCDGDGGVQGVVVLGRGWVDNPSDLRTLLGHPSCKHYCEEITG